MVGPLAKRKENDAMDGPMVNVWLEESMPPSSIKPVSKGEWVGLDSWPSNEVLTQTYQLTHGKLLEERDETEERVLLKTPLNHGLLSGEWMGAGVPGKVRQINDWMMVWRWYLKGMS